VISVEYAFRLRLVVARVGEMDLARWWNTKGQLGSLGASVLSRGFPRTHRFAQARSVFAVAAHRCREVYQPPNAVTLWDLPAELEDDLNQRWEDWIDDAAEWEPFFKELERCSADLAHELTRLSLVKPSHVTEVGRLRRSAEQRAVAVPGEFVGSDDDLAMLALAFSRGESANPTVPYQVWREEQ
jgi:hypothetical protein